MGIRGLQSLLFASAVSLSGATTMHAEDSTYPEFPAENAALIAATADFFDRVEARRMPKSRMPVISNPRLATKIRVDIDDEADAMTERGPVDHLTGYRITWYPTDRLLGSVDFMGTWDGNRNLVCGFLTWDLTDAETPQLETVSARFLDLDWLSAQDDETIHAELLEANCAFGAIDENLHFFDATG